MANEPMIIKSQGTGDGEPGGIVVNYDSTNHLQVLFQMKGSVWPRVLPFCIVNTFLMFACDFWLEPVFTNMGIVFTGKEHGLLTIMVSFLVIR
jgi:predicted membrane chloride channel (bestrophin family)